MRVLNHIHHILLLVLLWKKSFVNASKLVEKSVNMYISCVNCYWAAGYASLCLSDSQTRKIWKGINSSMSKWMIKGGDLHPVGMASHYAARNLPHTVCNPSCSCRIQPSQQPKHYLGWKQREAEAQRGHLLLQTRSEPDQRNLLFGRSFRRHELRTCLELPPQSLARLVYRLLHCEQYTAGKSDLSSDRKHWDPPMPFRPGRRWDLPDDVHGHWLQ